MNRKRTEIYVASIRRSNDFVTIYFVHFARYIIRANFHEVYNIKILLNL